MYWILYTRVHIDTIHQHTRMGTRRNDWSGPADPWLRTHSQAAGRQEKSSSRQPTASLSGL